MLPPRSLEPIFHPPNQPEYHTVSEDELCQVEEQCGRPGRDLESVTLSLTLFTTSLTQLLAPQLLAPQLSKGYQIFLIIIVSVSGYVVATKGWNWYQSRKKGPTVIAKIRDRAKNQPDSPEE